MKLYAYIDGNQREGDFGLTALPNGTYDGRVILGFANDKIGTGIDIVKIALDPTEALEIIERLSAALMMRERMLK